MRSRKFVAALAAAVILLAMPFNALADEPEPTHFLDVSSDSYKIAFISGNFTAVVTRDIPRVVFLHTHAYLSPYFGVSFNKIYLFNDTDHDGFFTRSEAVYTAFLDIHHVNWNISAVQFGTDAEAGEYTYLTMRSTVSLWEGLGNASSIQPTVPDWANVTFNYRITENSTSHTNAYGSYVVPGRTDMMLNYTLQILKHVEADGIAFESALNGGGSTDMFKVRPYAEGGSSPLTLVPSRIDESFIGDNFTHKLAKPPTPEQSILFAKENGTVQAHYRYSSEPTAGIAGEQIPMNSSYYTTGSGMILHIAYRINSSTDQIHQESTLGIDEKGFIVKVGDWFRNNLAMLLVVVGSLAAIIAMTIFFFVLRDFRRTKRPPEAK